MATALSFTAIAPFMARQWGLVTRTQARGAGLSDDRIDTLVHQGLLRIVQPGVFASRSHPGSWEASVLAVCLSTNGLASHRSAARLWRLDGLDRGRRVEVTVPRDGRRRPEGPVVHSSTQFGLASPRVIRGIPTTGIDRTLLDIGGVVGRDKVLQAVDDALRRDLTTTSRLVGVLVDQGRRGRNGSAVLRSVLESTLAERRTPRSMWSRWVSDLLTGAGLPALALEHPVTLQEGEIFIDLAYPDRGIAIELQSHIWHRGAGPFERGNRRIALLGVAGWTVLPYTWRFYTTRPKDLINEVRTTLSA